MRATSESPYASRTMEESQADCVSSSDWRTQGVDVSTGVMILERTARNAREARCDRDQSQHLPSLRDNRPVCGHSIQCNVDMAHRSPSSDSWHMLEFGNLHLDSRKEPGFYICENPGLVFRESSKPWVHLYSLSNQDVELPPSFLAIP